MADIDDFTREIECIYKDERYVVRDNGAVFRYPRDGRRPRKYDNFWTFGNPNIVHGYMEIASARVHIIVATAFLGPKPTKEYVVDHIDTNRQNNRVENLRWVTRLENALCNPITRKRIIIRCGSIEAFLANPALLRENDMPSDLSWMRTVTNAEAQVSKQRLLEWADSDKKPSGGALGDWIFREPHTSSNTNPHELQPGSPNHPTLSNDLNTQNNKTMKDEYIHIMPSLTPGAYQRIEFLDDKPCEYPCTPQQYTGDPLVAYAANLHKGVTFWRNHNGDRAYTVVKYGFSKDKSSLYVMSMAAYRWERQNNGDTAAVPLTQQELQTANITKANLSINEVVYNDNKFIHIRTTTGFLPYEEIEDIFTDCTNYGEIQNCD